MESLDKCFLDDGESTVGDMIPGQEDVEGAVLDVMDAGELQERSYGQKWIHCQMNSRRLSGPDFSVGKPLRATGERIGVTIERVRQIESKALRELRKPSHSRKLQPFLPEAIGSRAYSGNGVEAFNRTWTSSTERIAMML